MRAKINDLVLTTFDKKNHANIYNELISGESQSEYVKEISKRLLLGRDIDKFSFSHAYLVEISNQIVGYLFISDMARNQVYLEYSILKQYRKKGLGKYILENISNFIFENYCNIKQINLNIDPSNIASTRTALSAGYDMEDEYDKNTIDNKKNFIRDNPYYINKSSKGITR